MASSTEICNLSLFHLGVGKEISNLETDRGQEALACKRFFELCRDAVLRDFPWPFATKIVALGLVSAQPNTEWGFSYRYPSDCLHLRRILSSLRNDSRQSRVPYRIAQDDSGKLIYTDRENAELEYTVKITDPQRFDADFTLALSFRIAGYVAPRIAGGDPFKLGQRAFSLYTAEIEKARASAVNEEQVDEEVQSEFIRGRN